MKERINILYITIPKPQGWDVDDAGMRELRTLLLNRIAWVVLVAYTILLLKPVMPAVTDKLAHTFWKQHHLLTVHEVSGRFHMHNEMVQGAKQSEKDKHTCAAKADTYDCITVNNIKAVVSAHSFTLKNVFYPIYSDDVARLLLRLDYPPPQLLPVTAGATNAV